MSPVRDRLRRKGSWRSAAILALALAFALAVVGPARAHDPFETTTQVLLHGDRVEIEMVMARATARELFGAKTVPSSRDGSVRNLPLGRLYELSSTEGPLVLGSKAVEEGLDGEEKGDLVFRLVFFGQLDDSLTLRARYLEDLSEGFTGIVQVSHADLQELRDFKVLHSGDPTLTTKIPDLVPKEKVRTPRDNVPFGLSRLVGDFLKLGAGHVLLGWDHLLFLLGLLFTCRHLRQLVGVLTAFTLAHSVTLSLAAFHVLPLVSEFVEPMIALSIAVSAFSGRALQARRLLLPLTFLFGLIHGLGFAAGLESLLVERSSRLLGLVAFNLGVEAGQIFAVLIAFPVLDWCRKRAKGEATLDAAAIAVGAVGGVVFVLRVMDAG